MTEKIRAEVGHWSSVVGLPITLYRGNVRIGQIACMGLLDDHGKLIRSISDTKKRYQEMSEWIASLINREN